jgi:hypothetical protein
MQDICPSPDPDRNVKVKLLHELCRWFGGEHRLAHYLGVEVETIADWLGGARPVPDHVFLACLDVLRPGGAT